MQNFLGKFYFNVVNGYKETEYFINSNIGKIYLFVSLLTFLVFKGQEMVAVWCLLSYPLIIITRSRKNKDIIVRAELFRLDTPTILDTVVNEYVRRYMIYTFPGITDLYISEEQEVLMKHTVVDMVVTAIGGSVIEEYLKAYYGFNYADEIMYHIDMVITDTVINVNTKEKETKSKGIPLNEAKVDMNELMKNIGIGM